VLHGDVRYRPARPDDVAAEHAVFCGAIGELYRARSYPWTAPPLAEFAKGRAHVMATDPDRCWVAELDERLVGYTGAIVRDGAWFFSSLFVDPAAQGRGIGAALYDRAVAGAPSRRLTITDSIQPISNGLYGAKGLLPVAPLFRLAGTARGHGPVDLEPRDASIEELARVDRAAYGFERRADHPYWASRGTRHAWSRGGTVVAWSYRWQNGNIGPLAAADADTAAEAYRAELALDPAASIELPATARPLLAAALASGLRIEGPMGLLLASDGVPAPTSLAIGTYGLY
jgi:GNAT superfamily N-acetyltransferase